MSKVEKEVIVPSDPASREKIRKVLELIGNEWAVIDGHKAVVKETIDAVAEVLATSTFLYWISGSVGEEFAPIIGGLITMDVPLTMLMTRKVFNWPVLPLVMWFTASMPAIVNIAPGRTPVVVVTVTVW